MKLGKLKEYDEQIKKEISKNYMKIVTEEDELTLADFPELVDPHLAAIVGLTCFVLRIEEFELQNRLVNN